MNVTASHLADLWSRKSIEEPEPDPDPPTGGESLEEGERAAG